MDVSRSSTSLNIRLRAYDSPNVKEVVASGPGCDDNTIAGRGVDIAILGVDIAILGVDIAILGVDIAILRRQEKGWGLQGEGGGGVVAV